MAALIFGKFRLSEQAKEHLVESICPGKTSLRQLTNREADLVINELKRRAGQVPMKPVEAERRQARQAGAIALITPAQHALLAELTTALVQAGVALAYQDQVRIKACGWALPRTSVEAEKAIEALKALRARVEEGWRPKEPA